MKIIHDPEGFDETDSCLLSDRAETRHARGECDACDSEWGRDDEASGAFDHEDEAVKAIVNSLLEGAGDGGAVIQAKWYGETVATLMKDPDIIAMAREAKGHIPPQATHGFMMAANAEAKSRGLYDKYPGMPWAIGSVANALIALDKGKAG